MRARIYSPAKTAMQSGQAKSGTWVLEFSPAQARRTDPLMGWTSSGDMDTQVRLKFDSEKAAQAYAAKHGIDAVVMPPQTRKRTIRPGGYGDNFSFGRKGAWTH